MAARVAAEAEAVPPKKVVPTMSLGLKPPPTVKQGRNGEPAEAKAKQQAEEKAARAKAIAVAKAVVEVWNRAEPH